MKILNLYAGIGGNRKLWGDEHEVTAIEIEPAIARIYEDLFPKDQVICADAHQYLLDHYKEFDFIWSSPPCPTHSVTNHFLNAQGVIRYPDMSLWQEIAFLRAFYKKGSWVVENVRSYYKPLIQPQEIQSHYFWSNFLIPDTKRTREKVRNDKGQTLKVKMEQQGIFVEDFHGYDGDKRTLLNNCIEPELGLHILSSSFKPKTK